MPVFLNHQAGTSLYLPVAPGQGERMAFLQWAGTPAPQVTLDTIWDPASGRVGYLLFLSALPADQGEFQAAEAALRAALPKPARAATSLAWVAFAANWSVESVNPLLLGDAGAGMRTAIGDFTAPGVVSLFPSVTVLAGTLVTPVADAEGAMGGAAILYPPLAAFDGQPASQRPSGAGIAVPLAGAGVGCLQFQGLMDSQTRPSKAKAVAKDLFEASLDPLAPFDISRTYLKFTGQSFLLSRVKQASGPFDIQPC